MSIVLALPRLHDAVVARFSELGDTTPQPFGWREPDLHKTSTARIVWVPGDPSGDAGEIGPPKQPGRLPRPIGTLFELFHCRIQAVDPTTPENERAQYQVVRELFTRWHSAVYRAARGTFSLVSLRWNTEKKVRRYGAELIVVGWVEAMLPEVDGTAAETFADRAVIVDSLEDVDEMISIGSYLITESGDFFATEDAGVRILHAS
jgi:hypothetical protein